MGWNLTTPVSTVHGGSLNEIRLTTMRHDSRPPTERILCAWEYGKTDAGVWIPGEPPAGTALSHVVDGAEYTALVQAALPDVQTSDPSDPTRYAPIGAVWVEYTYYAVKRGLYEHLNSEGHIPNGTVA